MTTLHLISASSGIRPALDIAADDDAILLLGEGAGLAASHWERTVHVLADDLPAGFDIAPGAIPIDYAGFVELVTGHNPIITWR